jgi:hypothetical protein
LPEHGRPKGRDSLSPATFSKPGSNLQKEHHKKIALQAKAFFAQQLKMQQEEINASSSRPIRPQQYLARSCFAALCLPSNCGPGCRTIMLCRCLNESVFPCGGPGDDGERNP